MRATEFGIGGYETTSFVVDPNSACRRFSSALKHGVTTRYVYGVGSSLRGQLLQPSRPTTTSTRAATQAAITNNAGLVVGRVDVFPYGLVRSRLASYDTPFLYGGAFGVATDANGLVHMRSRYYNPLTCRFVNSDPPGISGTGTLTRRAIPSTTATRWNVLIEASAP